jgi:hypothetical protein
MSRGRESAPRYHCGDSDGGISGGCGGPWGVGLPRSSGGIRAEGVSRVVSGARGNDSSVLVLLRRGRWLGR